MSELDAVTFRRVDDGRSAVQVWDVVAPNGAVFARAEVFPGEQQWGVRLSDRAPAIEDGDLLRMIARLLVWHVGCPADTVDVVLGRTHAHHTLVKVGGDYV